MRGRHLLYEYCRHHGIPHKQIGKLIVATRPSEIPKLSELMSRGVENGVEGLRMMDAHEAMHLEPELYCTKALLSPVSGIVDSHSLMLSLLVCSLSKRMTRKRKQIAVCRVVFTMHIDRSVAFRGKLRTTEPSSLTTLL